MNQLSYEVSNRRFIEQGYRYTGSIESSIKETIRLLSKAGNPNMSSDIFAAAECAKAMLTED